MPLNNILRNAYRLEMAVEFNSNNTLSEPWDRRDFSGGTNYLGAVGNIFKECNSNILAATNSIKGASVSAILDSGPSYTVSLPEPFEGSSGAITSSPISFLNIDSRTDIKNRVIDGKPVSVKVGGLLNRGKSNQQDLDYSEFETLIDGVFVGHDITPDSIDASLGMKSDDLLAKFPPLYESGVAKGKARPYIAGTVEGRIPVDLGDGLYEFNYLPIDSVEPALDENRLFPAISLGSGVDYFHDLRMGYELPDPIAGVTTTKDSINWSVASAQRATSSDGAGFTIVSKNGLSIEQGEANELNFSLSDAEIERFTASQFTWGSPEVGKLKTTNGPDVNVALSGGIALTETVGRYFKIETDTTGTVSIETVGRLIKSLKLVIRSIDTSIQTIDQLSTEPDSISPLFTNTNENHTLTFNNLNKSNLSFDYTCATTDQVVAIWIQDIELYEPVTTQIEISLNELSDQIDLVFGIENESQKLISIAPSATISSNIGLNTLSIQDETKSVLVNLEIGYGKTSFYVNSIRHDSNNNFVDYEDGVVRISPPPVQGGQTGTNLYGIFSEFTSFGVNNLDQNKFQLTFKARVVSSDVEKVSIALGLEGAGLTVGEVTQQNKQFSYTLTTKAFGISGLELNLSLATWRGDQATLKSTIITNNADVDFTVEITDLLMTPIDYTSDDIRVYDDSATRTYLPTFCVKNAREYKGRLPVGMAVFDKTGMMCVAPSYREIVGDFIGGYRVIASIAAFREISALASGSDQITANFGGDRIGVMVKDQKPWINHIAGYCDGADYYYVENKVGSGISVYKRYSYLGPPEFPSIPEEIIIHDSLFREDKFPRQFRLSIEYRQDDTDPERTQRQLSPIGYSGKFEPKVIQSPLYGRDANKDLSNRIYRESVPSDLWRLELLGVGHDINVGESRYIMHPDLPAGRVCVISRVTEDDLSISNERKTMIKFRVFKGSALHG